MPGNTVQSSDRKRVTVVVPAYNAARTIEQCLSALMGQSYPRELFEVIVVDDGSTDQTSQTIKQFPVQYIHQNNQGPATARNAGAAAGIGDILLFTDADCVPDPHWIEEMTTAFEDPQVMAVKGAYRSRQPEMVARFAQIEFEERFDLLERAGTTDMVDTYAAGYRAQLFRELGGFDTRFPVANNEDTELSYRMAAAGHRMVFAPRAIVFHLGHPDSIRRYARLKFSRGYWRMVVYRRFPEKMLRDTYTPKSLKLQILALLFLCWSLIAAFFLDEGGLMFLLVALSCFLVTIVPFVCVALRKDFPVGLASPFLLAIRAAALGSGAVWGAWRGKL